MVVGHLRRVEHLLRLLQRLPAQGSHQLGVGRLACEARLEEPVHGLRALGVDVVAQEGGVHARIGGQLHLVELLDEVQRHLGREAELAVAVHLQRREVVEWRRCLAALLLLHLGHFKGPSLDELEGLLALLLRGELPLRGGEGGVAVDGGQHPVGLWLEVVNLLLSVHDEGEGGGLHAADAEHLAVLSVLDGVEARGVDAQQPVAHGAAQSGQVERLVFALALQLGKALADGLVGHRRDPQPLHGAADLCFLHHPALDELTLLAGVAAVDDAVGLLEQPFDDGELLLHPLVFLQPDAEAGRNHGQRRQRPGPPRGRVVLGHLQLAQVAEGPRHLVAVALVVAVAARRCPDDAGDVLRHAGLLCYANNHLLFL